MPLRPKTAEQLAAERERSHRNRKRRKLGARILHYEVNEYVTSALIAGGWIDEEASRAENKDGELDPPLFQQRYAQAISNALNAIAAIGLTAGVMRDRRVMRAIDDARIRLTGCSDTRDAQHNP